MAVPDITNAGDIGSNALSPGDFVQMYWNVEAGDSIVSINKYMIGDQRGSPKATQRNAVYNAALKQGRYVDKNAFTRSHMGKVSPSDCGHILNLALETGVVKEANIQSWADANLGVDCTGFAVAYFNEIGRIDIDKFNGGAGCHYLVGRALKNKAPGLASALIWDQDDVRVGDMVVWMTDKMVETRSPGHIALISYIDVVPETLLIAESSGASDGSGHFGPKHNRKLWGGPQKVGDSRHLVIENTAKVIIVRPPASFA